MGPVAESNEEVRETDLPCDLFLSYTRVDKDWVRDLAAQLERESLRGRQLNVFFDEWEIRPGANIVASLENGVSKARFVGVVLSPEMLAGEWPTLEWTMAVYEDPSGRKGKVIPILKRDCEIPPSLRVRNVLDFRTPERQERSYAKLLAVLRNEPLPRGHTFQGVAPMQSPQIFAKPLEFADEVQERIASNIFPIESLPRWIWSAETEARSYGEVYRHLRKIIVADTLPTFILRQNRIYTFCNLEDRGSPFGGLVSPIATIRKEDTYLWSAEGPDQDGLLELLNRAPVNNSENLGLYHDRQHNRTYFLTNNGGNRIVEWDTGTRRSRRTVVKRYQKGPNGEVFWAHLSVVLRFILIESRIFLRMEPGWTFTRDGVTPLPRREMQSISTRWMYDEYNPSIFYHLRFWTYILSQAKRQIVLDAGGSSICIEPMPATALMKFGVEGDHFSFDKLYEVAEAETPPVDYLLTNSDERSMDELPADQEQQQ